MTAEPEGASAALADALVRALAGEDAHVDPERALAGLDAGQAGRLPGGAPHSVYQILCHVLYWQDLLLQALRGSEVAWPSSAAEGWRAPPRPAGEEAWREAVDRFLAGVHEARERARELAANPEHPHFRYVLILALHNSYHLGQIVLLRRLMGAWPPPGGGDTW